MRGRSRRGLVRNQQVVVVLQKRGGESEITRERDTERESERRSQLSLDCLSKESIRIHSARQPMTNVGEERVPL